MAYDPLRRTLDEKHIIPLTPREDEELFKAICCAKTLEARTALIDSSLYGTARQAVDSLRRLYYSSFVFPEHRQSDTPLDPIEETPR